MVEAFILAAGIWLSGTVEFENTPLPGCTVTATDSAGVVSRKISDANGAYRVAVTSPGTAWIRIELDGFRAVEDSFVVAEGENPLGPMEMGPIEMVEITISCSMTIQACSEGDPETPWDMPSCADYELETALIESASRGDGSAVDLLRRRYEHARTHGQKHRIAAALLRRVVDDREYWNELHEVATIPLRFPKVDDDFTEAFRSWCDARGLDADSYWWFALEALSLIADDPRARSILSDALRSRDMDLIAITIDALARSGVTSALPEIERALESAEESDQPGLATLLEPFRTEAADVLAFRFLDEDERVEYQGYREAELRR